MKEYIIKWIIKKYVLILVLLVVGLVLLIIGIILNEVTMSNSNLNNSIPSKIYLPNISKEDYVLTIAFVSDARPELGKINELSHDFNQIISQSPTGRVDALVMIGDMEYINTGNSNTDTALSASTAKSIPVFYVVGNHELNNIYDLSTMRAKFANYSYFPNPGPDGSRNTTYSFNVGNMHIIVLNEYWDGDSNNKCEWYTPKGGLNDDDSCFKYGSNDGGFIPDKLFDWIRNDLDGNNNKWIVVVGHEPLFPYKNHIRDSIDENLTNRNKLENLFISKNVTAFISGHTHVSNLEIIDGIYHANAGVIGDNVKDGDNFATITYAYANKTDYFVLDQIYENPEWNKPKIKELARKK